MLPKQRNGLDLGQENSPRESLASDNGHSDPLPGVSSYSTLELIQIKDKATAELARREPLNLRDLDIEQEMVLQLHTLKTIQSELLQSGADAVQPTVLNAVSGAIDKLAQRQTQVYSSERFKAVENTLLRVLRSLPEATVQAFLADYEAVLSALAQD